MKIKVVESVLNKNQDLAESNRALFDQKGIYAINLMSSPGAGKTTLLERTIEQLSGRYKMAVIEGDVQDTFDAERIARFGIPVVQINTGGGCHIDSNMVREAFDALELDEIDLLFIENVGNLVCPAYFKLGENHNITILSTPEGADKPAKYPQMFDVSDVLLINKIDLLEYVDFDVEKARNFARGINQQMEIFEVSCKSENGLNHWLSWLTNQVESFKASLN